MGKVNRRTTQDNKAKKVGRYDQKKQSASNGESTNVFSLQGSNDWKLDSFHPSEGQYPITQSMVENYLTIVDAPSGCGKTSVTLWKALMMYRNRDFRQIVFIRNPTEAGDDQIGYLSGDADDKLKAHFHETRRIFTNFISKGKLEADESAERIQMVIPNFLLGATLDDSLIIIDEAQTMSPATVKFLVERAGRNSHVVLLGDSKQRYSVKQRNDGFRDLINKVTHVNEDDERVSCFGIVGYVRLTTEENHRSELSKLITELYE